MSDIDSGIDHLKTWIGRRETTAEPAAAGAQAGLAALFDHETPPWHAGELAPLAHWLHFLPRVRQSELGADGHPRLGGFLPPVPLPRRMWAGSLVRFHAPIPLGAMMERRSSIADVAAKSGRSGSMVFVKVRHEIRVGASIAIEEEQDIVYREAPPAAKQRRHMPSRRVAAQPPRPSQVTREVSPDPVQLFRYSALTFNGHRIHYDLPYCRDVEGYPGLVVHGPLVAMLLLDHFLRHNSPRRVRTFRFRAERPLFATAPFELCLAATPTCADLWTVDSDGEETMCAAVETA